jgi:hypothetical protein
MSDMAATKAIGEKRIIIRRLYEIELEAAAIRERLETSSDGLDGEMDPIIDMVSNAQSIMRAADRWEALTEVANA